jgi:hypothetical protein
VADEPSEFPVAPVPEPEKVPKRKGRTQKQIDTARANLAKAAKVRADKAASKAAGKPPETPDARALKQKARSSLIRWRSELGAGGLLIVPVPATYIARTDDEVIEAMVTLAGRNAKLLAGLAAGGDLLAAIVVMRWAAGLGVAAGVQWGRVAPDSTLAQTFGVTDIVIDLEREGMVGVERTGDGEAPSSTVPDFDGRPSAPAVVAVS